MFELGQRLQFRLQPRRPSIELLSIGPLQSRGILRTAFILPEAQKLALPQIHIEAGNPIQLLLEGCHDDLHIRPVPILDQVDVQPATVLRLYPGQIAFHPRHRRQDGIDLLTIGGHLRKRVVLRSFQGPAESSHIYRRHESFRHLYKQNNRKYSHGDAHTDGRAPLPQDGFQRAPIPAFHG
jgi:hypothetical protein